jgi:uncharacterized protein (TIGR00730 family)
MGARKTLLIDRADAFITLPGGLGTLDELFEVWTTATLSLHRKPILLLDADGFYSGLLEWLRGVTKQEFIRREAMAMILVAKDVQESLDLVEEALIRT